MSDKMTEISKQQAVIIRELMKTVLEPALLEKGLKIQKLGNATYDGDSITFKGLSIALLDAPKPHEKALQNELEARRTHKDIAGLYGAVLDQSKIANLPKLGMDTIDALVVLSFVFSISLWSCVIFQLLKERGFK